MDCLTVSYQSVPELKRPYWRFDQKANLLNGSGGVKQEIQFTLVTEDNRASYFEENYAPSPHPPSLIVTGATASLRGFANSAAFAAGKFAQRAIVQSLAREFHPKGVHVALAIIDAVIDIPRTKGYVINGGVEGGKTDPDAIADAYWHLHTQPKSAFTHEIDMRPYVEKF